MQHFDKKKSCVLLQITLLENFLSVFNFMSRRTSKFYYWYRPSSRTLLATNYDSYPAAPTTRKCFFLRTHITIFEMHQYTHIFIIQKQSNMLNSTHVLTGTTHILKYQSCTYWYRSNLPLGKLSSPKHTKLSFL